MTAKEEEKRTHEYWREGTDKHTCMHVHTRVYLTLSLVELATGVADIIIADVIHCGLDGTWEPRKGRKEWREVRTDEQTDRKGEKQDGSLRHGRRLGGVQGHSPQARI